MAEIKAFHPDELAAAYDYLRETRPFKRWKLPDSDALKFRVSRHNDRYGHFTSGDGPFDEIAVSSLCTKTYGEMLAVLAHEMIHLYQYRAKRETPGVQHNADFRALGKRVCKAHGFDFKTFI